MPITLRIALLPVTFSLLTIPWHVCCFCLRWSLWNVQQVDLYFRFWKALPRKLLTSVVPSPFPQPYRVAEVLEDAVPAAARLHQCHQAHHGGGGALWRVRRQTPLGRGGVAAPRWLHPLRGGPEPHPPPPPLRSNDPSECRPRAVSWALAEPAEPALSFPGWDTVSLCLCGPAPEDTADPCAMAALGQWGLLRARRKFPWDEHPVLLWLEPGSGTSQLFCGLLAWHCSVLYLASLFLPTSLGAPLCPVMHTVHAKGSEEVELVTSGLAWVGSMLQIQEKVGKRETCE